MQLSNTSTKDGMVQEIDDICGSNDGNYPIARKVARINQALDDYSMLALMYDRRWQFDDLNQNDLPIATRKVLSGQQDYTFADELLEVRKVFIKPPNTVDGSYIELEEETDETNGTYYAPKVHGVPTKFKLVGESIIFNNIPNYEMEAGLQVAFGRKALHMSDSNLTDEPGIPSIFHLYLCWKASLPYLIRHDMESKDEIASLIAAKEDPTKPNSIAAFMANRNRAKPRLQFARESNK